MNYFEDFNSLGFVFFNFIFVAEFLSYLMNNIVAVVLFCKDEIIFYMFTSLLNYRVPFQLYKLGYKISFVPFFLFLHVLSHY